MVAYKETAEEQLLRMIEGPRGAPAPSSEQAAPAMARRPGMPLGPLKELWGDLKNRFRRALVSFRGKASASDPLLWNLQLAGRFLWLLLAVLGVYVVLDLVVMQPAGRVADAISSARAGSEGAVPSVRVENPLKPLADYIGAVIARDPFTGAVPGVSSSPVKTSEHQLEEMAKGLVLVGIDRGPRPAALVEDTEKQKTFVVNTGDQVNGMKVKEINSEGVVLSYEGEEYVLR